jgi:hypothetical protein
MEQYYRRNIIIWRLTVFHEQLGSSLTSQVGSDLKIIIFFLFFNAHFRLSPFKNPGGVALLRSY